LAAVPTRRRGMSHPLPDSDWTALWAHWAAQSLATDRGANTVPPTLSLLVLGACSPSLLEQQLAYWRESTSLHTVNLSVFVLAPVLLRPLWDAYRQSQAQRATSAKPYPALSAAHQPLMPFYWLEQRNHPKSQSSVQITVWLGEPGQLLRQLSHRFDAVIALDASDKWLPSALSKILKDQGVAGAPINASDWAVKGFDPLLPAVEAAVIAPAVHQALQWWQLGKRWPARQHKPARATDLDTQSIAHRHIAAPTNARPSVQIRAQVHPSNPLPATFAPRIAIIGAGLAGAVTARTLAQKGWRVVVFDKQPRPAMGGSGLPVGLVCPQLQSNDPLAELTRIGVGLTFDVCQQLLVAGQDFAITGVQTQRHLRQPNTGESHTQAATFIPLAGWVKPQALVNACLRHPLIEQVMDYEVVSAQSLVPTTTDTSVASVWQLHGKVPNAAPAPYPQRFDHLVLANAMALNDFGVDSQSLAQIPLRPISGQLSYGLNNILVGKGDSAGLPELAQNGYGHLIPSVPFADGSYWFAGASYRIDSTDCALTAQDRADNLAKARTLWPPFANQRPNPSHAQVLDWAGVRCTTPDRLPLVGPKGPLSPQTPSPAHPHLMVGFGSRGLSLVPLCAQILACQLANLPSPVPLRLLKALAPARYITK
jgi:glycine/D-amino acid oxidase-like deaminating enzyme